MSANQTAHDCPDCGEGLTTEDGVVHNCEPCGEQFWAYDANDNTYIGGRA
jgi:uncharacterized protein (DUF983 family)